MRLFVALNLPEEERHKLHRATGLLRAAGLPVRWVAEDALHLTLQFLGDVHEAQLEDISEALESVSERHQALTLELRGIGGFPNLRRPRVLWVGIEAQPEVLAVQRDVSEALLALRFTPESRPYAPHLTIGRVQEGARAAAFAGLDALAGRLGYHASVAVPSVDLMRSHLQRSGARYERLLAATLGHRQRRVRQSTRSEAGHS